MPVCLICRRETQQPPRELPGLKGDAAAALVASLCALPECHDRARRFAARRAHQAAPSAAGMLVAALGVATGGLFLATGRDLGQVLIVVGLLGAGTTRLAYPDAVPLALVRRLGLDRAIEAGRWAGVALGALAVAAALGLALT